MTQPVPEIEEGEAQEFYDALAAGYDDMTEFDSRLQAASMFVERLRARIRFRSALDMACGTGVFAIALAQAGADVWGTDLSEAMLGQARERAQTLGLAMSWVQAPMQAAHERIDRTFDLILCMGNSLPHLLTQADLDDTLTGCRRLLNGDGHLVLHLLNYERILARQERIVNITRQGEKEYLRFYDFLASILRFNVLEVDWAKGAATHRLQSVELYPYRQQELEQALVSHGFSDIEAFGSLDLQPHDPGESPVLTLIARSAPE